MDIILYFNTQYTLIYRQQNSYFFLDLIKRIMFHNLGA